MIRELAAHHHLGVNLLALYTGNIQHHAAIIQQQAVPRRYVIGQGFVITANAVDITGIAVHGHIQYERLALFQIHCPLFKAGNANFGALQIT